MRVKLICLEWTEVVRNTMARPIESKDTHTHIYTNTHLRNFIINESLLGSRAYIGSQTDSQEGARQYCFSKDKKESFHSCSALNMQVYIQEKKATHQIRNDSLTIFPRKPENKKQPSTMQNPPHIPPFDAREQPPGLLRSVSAFFFLSFLSSPSPFDSNLECFVLLYRPVA